MIPYTVAVRRVPQNVTYFSESGVVTICATRIMVKNIIQSENENKLIRFLDDRKK